MLKIISVISMSIGTPVLASDIGMDICSGKWFHQSIINTNIIPTTPSTDFEIVDDENGYVRHKPTGLIWQRCLVGQTWNKNSLSCDGDPQHFYVEDALALAVSQPGWRVPNMNELMTTVEFCKSHPAMNTMVFPFDYPSNYYRRLLTSTPYKSGVPGSSVWVFVSVEAGYVDVGESVSGVLRLVSDDK